MFQYHGDDDDDDDVDADHDDGDQTADSCEDSGIRRPEAQHTWSLGLGQYERRKRRQL